MRIFYLVFCLLISSTVFSQKDTIINYYDYNNKKYSQKPEKIKFIEIISKKNDTLYNFIRYRNNGKIFAYWHSKTIDSKNKVGQFVMFDRMDSIKSITYYNQNGLKSGKQTLWFSNRNINSEGFFENDKKEGVWKFYHFNGNLAAKGFFKKDSLLKAYYFNEEGIKKNKPQNCCLIEPKFSGGIKKFNREIQSFSKKLKISLKGELIINYDINTFGDIENVEIIGSLQDYLRNSLIKHIENIEGWEPAEHLGRKIESTRILNIIFK